VTDGRHNKKETAWKNVGLERIIILRNILNRGGETVWSGVIWLRIGYGGGFFLTQQ